jgi:hypothetical protein
LAVDEDDDSEYEYSEGESPDEVHGKEPNGDILMNNGETGAAAAQ